MRFLRVVITRLAFCECICVYTCVGVCDCPDILVRTIWAVLCVSVCEAQSDDSGDLFDIYSANLNDTEAQGLLDELVQSDRKYLSATQLPSNHASFSFSKSLLLSCLCVCVCHGERENGEKSKEVEKKTWPEGIGRPC